MTGVWWVVRDDGEVMEGPYSREKADARLKLLYDTSEYRVQPDSPDRGG
jgi:hypothetical protein